MTRLVYIFISSGNENYRVAAIELAASKPPPEACIYIFEPVTEIKKKQMHKHLLLFYGAGDEARTRYLHLGKVALYRMSYTRNGHDSL